MLFQTSSIFHILRAVWLLFCRRHYTKQRYGPMFFHLCLFGDINIYCFLMRGVHILGTLLSVLIDIVNKIFTNMNLEAFVECYRYLSWTYVAERYLCRSHVFWQQLKIHSTHLVWRTVAFCTIVLLRTLTRICFIYLSSVSCLAI